MLLCRTFEDVVCSQTVTADQRIGTSCRQEKDIHHSVPIYFYSELRDKTLGDTFTIVFYFYLLSSQEIHGL